jgi:hypothetical protein
MMTNQPRAEAIAEKRRFWKQQIQHWKDSGLTQTEFCRLHNLKAHQLTYWKKRFHRTESPVSLIELQWGSALQSGTCSSCTPLRLILNEQYRIDIDRGFDPVTLQQLVLSLRQL